MALLLVFFLAFALSLYVFPQLTAFLDKAFALCFSIILLNLPTTLIFTILETLELGVAVFCYRLSLKIQDDWVNQHLQETFRLQAESELVHAKFFNRFSGRKKLALYFETFDKTHGTIDGIQVDTISTHYLSTKILFGFRSANTYELNETLAFMAVLEQFQSVFYKALSLYPCFKPIKTELTYILEDEEKHSIDLLAVGNKKNDILIWKWQVRKYLALLFVPVDVIWYLVKLAFS
jgi:hypothetical protein